MSEVINTENVFSEREINTLQLQAKSVLAFINGKHNDIGHVVGFWRTVKKHEVKSKEATKSLLDSILSDNNTSLSEIYFSRAAKKSPSSVRNAIKKKKASARNSNDEVSYFSTKKFKSAWVNLKYDAYVIYGNYCVCCGARPSDAPLTVDHIIPKSVDESKSLDIRNLQILCKNCNSVKGNSDKIDWRTTKQKFDAMTYYHFPQSLTTFKKEKENA